MRIIPSFRHGLCTVGSRIVVTRTCIWSGSRFATLILRLMWPLSLARHRAGFFYTVNTLTQVAILAASPEQDRGQFIERLCIDFTLELDNGVQWHPIFAPAPRIKFRRIGCTQTDI